MRLAVTSAHGVILSHMPEQAVAMLQALPAVVASGRRLPWEQEPVSGAEDAESAAVREDWDALVRPELREQCEAEVGVVVDGLRQVREITPGPDEEIFEWELPGPLYEIHIHPENVESWFGALSQARLAIESIHGFGGTRPEPDELETWPEDKQAAFWQTSFFAAIQEGLLFSMEQRMPPENPD